MFMYVIHKSQNQPLPEIFTYNVLTIRKVFVLRTVGKKNHKETWVNLFAHNLKLVEGLYSSGYVTVNMYNSVLKHIIFFILVSFIIVFIFLELLEQ